VKKNHWCRCCDGSGVIAFPFLDSTGEEMVHRMDCPSCNPVTPIPAWAQWTTLALVVTIVLIMAAK